MTTFNTISRVDLAQVPSYGESDITYIRLRAYQKTVEDAAGILGMVKIEDYPYNKGMFYMLLTLDEVQKCSEAGLSCLNSNSYGIYVTEPNFNGIGSENYRIVNF